MANIVGLGSTQDPLNATGQERLRPAVHLDDGLDVIKPVSLRPQAAPIDTYHRPQQAPINHDFENLIQGLSSLNRGLSAFGAATKKPEEIDKDALAQKYGSQSPEAISRAINAGAEPQKEAAAYLGHMRATKIGDQDAAALTDWYNTKFDKTNGNLQEELNQYVAKRSAETFAGNPSGLDAYQTRMAGFARGLLAQHAEFRKTNNDFMVGQDVTDATTSVVRQAIDAGYSPERLTGEMARVMENNKQLLGYTYKQSSQIVINGLKGVLNDVGKDPSKSEAAYAAAQALLEGDRKDPRDGVSRRIVDLPDGVGDTAKGMLADFKKARDDFQKGKVNDTVASIKYSADNNPDQVDLKQVEQLRSSGMISNAEAQQIQITRAKSLEALAQKQRENDAQTAADQAASTLTQQDYEKAKNLSLFQPEDHELPTKDSILGKPGASMTTVSGSDRQKAVITAFQKDQDFERNRRINAGDKADAVDQDLQGKAVLFYSQNGMAPKEWGTQAKGAVNQLTTMMEQSGTVPQEALQALDRYKTLKAQGRNLLPTVYGEREKEVLDMASNLPGSPEQQLQVASRAFGKKDEKRDAVIRKEVQAEVSKTGQGILSWAGSWFGGERPDNFGLMGDRVQRRAEAYVRATDMSPKDALAQAMEDTKGDFVSINNKLVDVGDKRLPPNAQGLLKNHLGSLDKTVGAKAFGADGPGDLTLTDGPNGTFQVISKKHGISFGGPVYVEDPESGERYDARFIDAKMLNVLAQRDRSEKEQTAVTTGENRLKPLWVLPGTTVGIGRPHIFETLTPAEQAQERKNFDAASKPKGSNKEFVEMIHKNAEEGKKQKPPLSDWLKSTPRNPFNPDR